MAATDAVRANVARLAPGTPLRDGLDRIVNGRTGALIVLGTNPVLEEISTGGFALDVPLSATALRELAKMDGAIVLSPGLDRILHASVHLMPDARLDSVETGTRHRTAERVSRQTGLSVVTVSSAMATISLFHDGQRRPIHRPEFLIDRAHHALGALAGYRTRLLEAVDRLSALEVSDQVTLRDLAEVAQRLEMTGRLAAEVQEHVDELGVDGRLIALQLHELAADLGELERLLARDYPSAGERRPLHLARLDDAELLDLDAVGGALAVGAGLRPDSPLRARGHRQLAGIPRLPEQTADELIDHFGSLAELFGASTAELVAVPGVSFALARVIRDGLVRMAESVYDR